MEGKTQKLKLVPQAGTYRQARIKIDVVDDKMKTYETKNEIDDEKKIKYMKKMLVISID